MSRTKVERLLNLTAALRSARRPLTRDELLQRVPGYPDDPESARRAFERDKDELRSMGVPIRVEGLADTAADQVAYRILPEEYVLADPGLEPEEITALHLAANAVRLDGIGGLEAFWKLGVDPPGPESEVDPVAHLSTDPRLQPLFAAVAEHHPVSFRYGDVDRVLEPHRIDFRNGHWYVAGHDVGRGEGRVFRVDRIDGDVRAERERSFTPPAAPHPGIVDPPWRIGGGPAVVVDLHVDADRASWAERHLGADAVRERGADGTRFAVEVTNVAAFRSFVLMFLDRAEVLGPAEVRDDIVAWLEAISAGVAS